MSNTLKQGILFALLAATVSGFSIFYNKLVLVKGVDPLVLNIVKNGGVALLLSLFLLKSQSSRELLQTQVRKHFKKLILIGIVGGSIPFVLFFEGLKLTSPLNAALIQKTLFLWVALLAVPLLKERLTKLQVGGYVLVLYANLFLGGFKGITFGGGEIMILAATLFWTAEALLAKKFLKEIDTTVLTWSRMFFGVFVLFFFAILQNKLVMLTNIPTEYLIPLLGSIGFLTLYVTFYFRALSKAPVTLTTAILVLSTPLTNILSAGTLTHEFPATLLQNAIVTLLGILILLRFLPQPANQHAKK